MKAGRARSGIYRVRFVTSFPVGRSYMYVHTYSPCGGIPCRQELRTYILTLWGHGIVLSTPSESLRFCIFVFLSTKTQKNCQGTTEENIKKWKNQRTILRLHFKRANNFFSKFVKPINLHAFSLKATSDSHATFSLYINKKHVTSELSIFF